MHINHFLLANSIVSFKYRDLLENEDAFVGLAVGGEELRVQGTQRRDMLTRAVINLVKKGRLYLKDMECDLYEMIVPETNLAAVVLQLAQKHAKEQGNRYILPKENENQPKYR
jgi:hypothetical protein